MWQVESEPITGGRGVRIQLVRDGGPLRWAEVIELWLRNEAFQGFWTSTILDLGAPALRWECPPLTEATVDLPFECVLLDAPGLERPADKNAFADHFNSDAVVGFANLRGDAMLVAPCPQPNVANDAYVHLAGFLRAASSAHSNQLWGKTAELLQTRLGHAPVWLSTAGMGVAWLHIRLDDRPKYYGYAPYRQVG